MKNVRFHIVALVAVAVSITVLTLGPKTLGQSPKPKPDSPVTPNSIKSERNSITTPTSFLVIAAERNASLRTELMWTFGGKQQRGWYLYDQLIRRTLNTESEPESVEFASALAAWQKRMGLSDDGILDQDTFMALVSYWQGNRLKNRAPAQLDMLTTSSSSEFYDPERLAELRQVERTTYTAYRLMLAAAIADPTLNLTVIGGELAPTEKYFKVISAFRSREYQEQLRRKTPNAGSAGLAVNSPHFTGRALDIYVGGDPVDTRDSNRAIQVKTPVYQWLVRNAERFGFRPYFYEPWHWEYVK